MNDFNNNWRRKQELLNRPLADAIYRQHIPGVETIIRYEHADDYLLDQKFAIDVTLQLKCGLILTGQEKFLSHHQSKYGSITIEHMQNPIANERGDWYKMAVQFYFVGYLNDHDKPTGFYPWVIVNWPKLVIATQTGAVKWMDNINKHEGARASFKYTKISSLPDECVIAKLDNI